MKYMKLCGYKLTLMEQQVRSDNTRKTVRTVRALLSVPLLQGAEPWCALDAKGDEDMMIHVYAGLQRFRFLSYIHYVRHYIRRFLGGGSR